MDKLKQFVEQNFFCGVVCTITYYLIRKYMTSSEQMIVEVLYRDMLLNINKHELEEALHAYNNLTLCYDSYLGAWQYSNFY